MDPLQTVPDICVFVRHSECKYRGDETWKCCNCRKHFRWTQNGVQYRCQAGTCSWAEAELRKHALLAQLMGRAPAHDTPDPSRLIDEAVKVFQADKQNQGVSADVLNKHARELGRLHVFAAGGGVFILSWLTGAGVLV